jgi:hypothetical protein
MRIRSIQTAFFAVSVLVMSSAAFGQVRISVSFGPPPLPVYEQPVCPGDGYIWTPGYWAWSDDDGRTGDGATARFFSMTAIGARKLGSTEASTTASAILEKVSLAGVGTMDTSSTTGQ